MGIQGQWEMRMKEIVSFFRYFVIDNEVNVFYKLWYRVFEGIGIKKGSQGYFYCYSDIKYYGVLKLDCVVYMVK